ncbi:unnamed protein product [Clonostachys byssicola]|uniref:Dimethylaniline monooxygenase [N-oxide-forming] 2 n=1 Tax=Clonostachys byssicola TaxID=160290 RepID=A0A9N9UU23_9HYPO|nr:unnamed protein product [Clonostachys byssicola]
MKVAVIGGGPSGLVTLKFLLEAHKYFDIPPIDARLFESEEKIGGTFVWRVYEDAELVSSKYLTAFSDFRFSPTAPDFVTPEQYVQYLNDYASHFGLWSKIECSTRVEQVRRLGQGHNVCFVRKGGKPEEWQCDAVAICSGLNVTPNKFHMEGLENVPIVLHSSEVKVRGQFGHNSNVVILGAGETAMDIGYLAITAPTRSVSICHRGGFFCAPKVIPIPEVRGEKVVQTRPNKPSDCSVASLFDTAYTHPALQRSPLPWLVYDRWVKGMHMLISGTEEGPDQWVGHMSSERKHVDSIFMCKSDRALPYISDGHRSESWWNKKRTFMINVPKKDTKGRRIDVLTWPEKFDDQGAMVVRDDDGNTKRIVPDVIVLATGYRTSFPFLTAEYPGLGEADVRRIYSSHDVTVGFVGFVRPSLGAIPPLAELQAQLWILRLLQHKVRGAVPAIIDPNALESYELDWKLQPRAGYDLSKTKGGVDHESYAYQLALDIGAAPRISYVMGRGLKVCYTWAMGSNFNTKFRIVGPWKWEGAAEIMEGELFDVVKRSGGLVYLFSYTIAPLILFGSLSIMLYLITAVFGLLTSVKSIVVKPFGSRKVRGSMASIE